jgi:hypothetical protein
MKEGRKWKEELKGRTKFYKKKDKWRHEMAPRTPPPQ